VKLAKRTLVAIILIAAVVAAILLHPLYLAGLLAIWVFLASLEFTRLLAKQNVRLPRFLLPFTNLILPAVTVYCFLVLHRTVSAFPWPTVLLALGLVWVYVVFAAAPRGPKLVFGSFGVLYLGLLPTHLFLLRQYTAEHTLAGFIVLFPLVATWVSDTAAYGFGKWLGRHKLTEISPHKTWEGTIAGILFSILFAVAGLGWCLPAAGPAHRIAIGLLLGIAALAGDLVESIFKREAGVKDSSSALSEHGGFLDRADSLLFTIPVFYYYLTLIIRPA
jgi:phosphatidate cytidylyltransferase